VWTTKVTKHRLSFMAAQEVHAIQNARDRAVININLMLVPSMKKKTHTHHTNAVNSLALI
jgi:hypothetical protein